jgi:hypothetical protein
MVNGSGKKRGTGFFIDAKRFFIPEIAGCYNLFISKKIVLLYSKN